MRHYCRECQCYLDEEDRQLGLCPHHQTLANDYNYFDALREEGHSIYAAKLMAGLADPPDPDDD